jgi:predicted phosphodiesterase
MVHGHLHTDVRLLLAARPDYLLSGHLHLPGDRRDGPTRRIHPGARHRADALTVVMLDLETDEVRFLTRPP